MGIEKPKKVTDARLRGNTDALRAMGRAGGKKSGELRKLEADTRALNDELALADRIAELAETEKVVDGEVLPPDPRAKDE